MKNIFKILFVFIATGALLFSCEEVETNFASLTKAPDPNATYYLQFSNAVQSFETGVSEDGSLVEVETVISVVLMGVPQASDIDIPLAVDASSTIDPDMYTLSSNSIQIPAGETSGSVMLSTIAENMPVGETLVLAMKMDAGEHNSPNPDATKIQYSLKRIEFCPLNDVPGDLAGSWTGDDAFYSSIITTAAAGSDLAVSGMSVEFIEDWWGEKVIDGGTITMKVYGNGIVEIPRQYIYTTEYEGAPYDYEIEGSGKWENCGEKPKLKIIYDIYYPGEDKGLAAQYSPDYLPTPYMEADIVLD